MRDSKRTRLVLSGLLLAAFALITVDARSSRDDSGTLLGKAREVGATVLGPVERAGSGLVGSADSLLTGWGHSSADRQQIAALSAQVANLRGQAETGAQAQTRAGQLDKLLHLVALAQMGTVPARLVALEPLQDGTWSATIDSGSRDGVRPDQTVLDGDGLVGRTTSVGPDTSTVLLAIDPSCTVGVRLAGSGEIGTAVGQDPHTLRVQFLDPATAVKPGQALVTLGSADGTPYVPGIPVGTVRQVLSTPGALTKTVLVTPSVDTTSADTVGVVVQPPRTDPRDTLVPPAG
ncbi:MAG TPA: rod shape-determining protein MreC [Actinocrinis sp.]|nr:rod shape-determining protein MreC [Actinocrinis sp.]